MSKRPHPDVADAVARAKAAVAGKFAKLDQDHKSPRSGSPSQSALNPDLQRRIEEAKARAAAKAAEAKSTAVEARGGLGVGLHPALAPDALLLTSKKNSQRSKFASTLANQKPEAPEYVPKAKRLEIVHGPGEDFTDREKNPYFDHKLGGRDTTKPTDRRSRPIAFNEPGKFIEKATQIRNEQNLKDLKARIAASARRAGLEEELDISSRIIAKQEPPTVEWWDQDFTKSYDDLTLTFEGDDSPITNQIQHPIQLPSPADLNNPGPAAIKLTKREQKKLRRQEREVKMKDKQDKQRLGLIPPDPPKVKLSNLPQVLAQSSIQDPTRIEQEVRAQVSQRLAKHVAMNAERALTKEQKNEKIIRQLHADSARGIYGIAWRVESLENGYHRRRIDENTSQLGISGIVIMGSTNLIIAEGGQKSIKFLKKLMTTRIKWTESPRGQEGEMEGNKCTLLWEGELRSRMFSLFRFHKCANEDQVKDVFGSRVQALSLWSLAKNYKEE